MAKVRIVRPSTNHTTTLKADKKTLIGFLSDVIHSLSPMVSRGMLPEDEGVILAFPPTIEEVGHRSANVMSWYAEEIPSLKAERRRLAKKLNKKDAAENESTRAELSGR